MKLLITCLLISSLTFGQKKGYLPVDSMPLPKPDTVAVIMNEFLTFLQDKITVKEYIPVQNYIQAFLKAKEYDKPKRK